MFRLSRPRGKIAVTPSRVYLFGECGPTGLVVCAYSPDMTPLAGWTFPSTVGTMAAGAAYFETRRCVSVPPMVLKADTIWPSKCRVPMTLSQIRS